MYCCRNISCDRSPLGHRNTTGPYELLSSRVPTCLIHHHGHAQCVIPVWKSIRKRGEIPLLKRESQVGRERTRLEVSFPFFFSFPFQFESRFIISLPRSVKKRRRAKLLDTMATEASKKNFEIMKPTRWSVMNSFSIASRTAAKASVTC